MWNFSKEALVQLEKLINPHTLNVEVQLSSYNRANWSNLLQRLNSYHAAKKNKQYVHCNNIENIKSNVHIKHTELIETFTTFKHCNISGPYRPNNKCENGEESKPTDSNVPIQFLNMDTNKEDAQKINAFVDSMNKGNLLTRDNFHEILSRASNINSNIVMDCIYRTHNISDICVFCELFILMKLNSTLINSFLECVLRPHLSLSCLKRYQTFDLLIMQIYEKYPRLMVDVIILPVLLNMNDQYNTSLLFLVQNISDRDKEHILNTFIDGNMFLAKHIPILEKMITKCMDDFLIQTLMKFLHHFNEPFADDRAFGLFLVKCVTLISPKIINNEKYLLETVIKNHNTIFKIKAMNMLGTR